MTHDRNPHPHERWRHAGLRLGTARAGRRWTPMQALACALVLAVWTCAALRVLVDHRPRLPLLVNWSASLPYHLAWLTVDRQPLQRGDLIVFRFEGSAVQHYPGLRHQPFFKRIAGLPGDRVSVEGRQVAINGQPVGTAKDRAHDRRPLTPIAAQVIPPGHYYVQGSSADSFDSRYASSGLVRADQVLGLARVLF